MVREFVNGYIDAVEESKINRPRLVATTGTGPDRVSPEIGVEYWTGYITGRLDWRNNTVDVERATKLFQNNS